MKLKLLFSSLFGSRNIGMLFILMAIPLALMIITGERWLIYPASAGVGAIYIGLVIQSFTSKSFQDKFIHKMKDKRIKKLNKMCTKLAEDAKKHTNPAYYKKLRSIMSDKNEIVKSYQKDSPDFLKEKITEQTLNLVVSYIRLLKSFCVRTKELNSVNIKPVIDRIAQNTRKLNFINDSKVHENVEKIIEMDQKIVSRLKDEKINLERIDTRLDYIKSTVYMFKQQIGLRLESEDMLEKIESAVNEATALENVLDERNKKRIRN
ncbi:hypothetical protein RBH29_06305 [Herbivorax sp. ANBcel31]|uniref:hypothetical protein n=1 Tax=Herbivorax sp. ANBcel31 TaxID=3069754 RepID=UPI0027B6E92D|nr:hypothetical protein [Herbivorax sp. ANBcel31]MDQ2086051.1 hypothetical protein [Herbivorax sp. ANBcel31]